MRFSVGVREHFGVNFLSFFLHDITLVDESLAFIFVVRVLLLFERAYHSDTYQVVQLHVICRATP